MINNIRPLLSCEVPFDKIKFPIYVSTKFDGIRALVIDGVVYSRSLKPIRNEYIQKLFGKEEYQGFDGELIVGDIFTSKQCGEFIVVEYINSANVVVKFLDTGYETRTRHSQVLSGQVKDRSLPSVYGVGIIGDSYSCWDGSKIRKEYDLWSSMLARCYSPKSHKARETYIGCTVSENFKSYTYFYEWCDRQVGFSENNFELDKDLLSGVSKYYSEGTCVFLPKEINVAIIKNNRKRSDFPSGVTYNKNNGNFVVKLSVSNGRRHIGVFNSVTDAFKAYKRAKEDYIIELAEKWKGKIDNRAYEALMKYEVNIDD